MSRRCRSPLAGECKLAASVRFLQSGPCGRRERKFLNVRVGVLGPLEVQAGGHVVSIAGPLPRRLLALLATRPGQFAPVDALVDGLWGGDPPAAARATLQSHVARLRRALGDCDVIVGGAAGYRLAINPA